MSETKAADHWEAQFDANFMRWFHLNDYPALVKVKSIRREELTMRGGKKNKRPVIEFEVIKGKIDDLKPLVMNKTNLSSIAKIAGTNSVADFVGVVVVLYPTTTQLYCQEEKKMVTKECIRIRAPKEQTSGE